MIIDPPSPFDPLPTWQEFLADLERIPEPDDDVKRSIEEARREIQSRGG